MPLYTVTTQVGSLNNDAKVELAAKLTALHARSPAYRRTGFTLSSMTILPAADLQPVSHKNPRRP